MGMVWRGGCWYWPLWSRSNKVGVTMGQVSAASVGGGHLQGVAWIVFVVVNFACDNNALRHRVGAHSMVRMRSAHNTVVLLLVSEIKPNLLFFAV